MNWSQSIDIYCERTDATFWSEPVNFLTNLSFIFAAVWAHRQLRIQKNEDPWLMALVVLAYCIGIGSATFHSVGTFWAQLADVIPIGVFLLLNIGYFCVRLAKFSVAQTVGAFAVFIGLTGLLSLTIDKELVNGSNTYFGTLAMLGIITVYAWKKGVAVYKDYLFATAAFVLSLTFRSIDMRVCEALPLGTHFLWHVFNGFVVFWALKASIFWPRSPTSSAIS